MMQKKRVTVQFCGFGGQGIVLASVVFGGAAVQAGLNAVQTQSYGSEARGGECQAMTIVSAGPVYSPLADQVDLLVAMSQPALDRYLDRLKPGGTLIIDPELVDRPDRDDIQLLEAPATRTAVDEFGQAIVANMVMLGFLQQVTRLVSEDALSTAIRENVPQRFLDLNLKAGERGMALGREQNTTVEV